MVLEWTLGLKRLAYSRIDLSLCCSVSLHLKGTWKTQNHQTFCVSLRGGSRIFRRGGLINDGKGEWGVPPPTQSREAFAIIVCQFVTKN